MRSIYSTILFIFICCISSSSWSQTFTPISGLADSLYYCVNDESNNVMLIGGGAENFVSNNQGLSWTMFNNAAGSPLWDMKVHDAVVIDNLTYCLIGIKNGNYYVARTNNGGSTWSLDLGSSQELRAIENNGLNVIISTVNGIYRSSDGGINWNYVSLSSSGEISNTVSYNGNSGSWFVDSYNTDMLISNDNGVTWSAVGYNFVSSEIEFASFSNNEFLLVQTTSNSNIYYRIDNTNAVVDSFEIIQGQYYGNSLARAAAFLPNGEILVSDNYTKFVIDPVTHDVYELTQPFTTGYGADMDIGANTGICAMEDWNDNVAYLIDPNQFQNRYVSSNFYVLNEASTCAGDDIIGIAYNTQGDSMNWYVNNIYVTSDTMLIYPTPGTYTSYNIECEVFYNGYSGINYTHTVTFLPPQPPHPYTYQTDTFACLDQLHYIFIDPASGTPQNTIVEAYYGNQLVAGPQIMTSSNMYLYTSPLNTSDTLYIVSMNTGACDNTADTISIPLTLGPDLTTYTVLPHDTVYCIGDSMLISLINTNPNYSYQFSTTNSTTYTNFDLNYTTNGLGTDTINISAYGPPISYNYLDDPVINIFIHLTITDPASGCSKTIELDTLTYLRSVTYYSLHSRSFLQNDTVHLTNVLPNQNRLWSSQSLSVNYINNNSDTIPLIIPDTTGFFDIQLKDEPLTGCVDSIKKYVHIANSAPDMDTTCSVLGAKPIERLHKIRFDKEGNRYEIGVYFKQFGEVPLYILRKYDQNGSYLWEKKAYWSTSWGYNDIRGVVMEEIDFDCDNNPVCAIWFVGEIGYSDQLINAYGGNNQALQWSFIVKIDKNNGDLIWRDRINDHLIQGSGPGGYQKITDLVVDDDLIHASAYGTGSWEVEFLTLDKDGNYVDNASTNFNIWNNSTWLWPNWFGSTGNYPIASFYSPQLDVLSTGEVIAIGQYRNITIPNYPQLNLGNADDGMFIMKYKPGQGVYDVEKLMQNGDDDHYPYGVGYQPYIEIDVEDNITFTSITQDGNFPYTVYLLDSTINMNSGILIVNIDTNYNINWFTHGSYGKLDGFIRAAKTGNYYLAMSSDDNISFGNEIAHLMVGEDIQVAHDYTSYPQIFASYDSLDIPFNDKFLVEFNEEGTPLRMKKIEYIDSVDYYNNITTRIAVTPCGDIDWELQSMDSYPTYGFQLDGQQLNIDTTSVLRFFSGCNINSCAYLNLPDTIVLCSSSTGSPITIETCEYFNIDTVSYDLYFNGSLLTAGNMSSVNNGSFGITLNMPGEYMLAFDAPLNDTTYIINDTITPPSYIYDDTICYGDIVNIQAVQSNFTYDWINGTYSGENVTLIQSDYWYGMNLINVEVSGGNCVYLDSVPLVVGAHNNVLDNQNACGPFIWIDGNTYTSTITGPTMTFTNIYGCDSTVTLYLIVNSVNTGITQLDSVTLKADVSGAQYQWVNCDSNYIAINGAIYQMFSTTQTGNYAVIVMQNGCTDTSECVSIGNVGINDQQFLDYLSLYPNPTTGHLTIDLGQEYKMVNVKQVNLLGQVIKEQKFKSTKRIDTRVEGAPGVYQFEIYVDDERKVTLSVLKE